MNKYLQKCNELTKQLSEEFKESGYSVISKLQIAEEINNFLENWEEFKELNLTDDQQENLINIVYDFYMNLENDEGIFIPTKAVMFTMLEYGDYFTFVGEYETNYSKVYDKLIWRL